MSNGSTLHLQGREIPLPPSWAVNAISSVDDTALLDVSEADERFAARVSAASAITKVDSFRPPFALAGDGRLIAGLAIAPVGVADTPQRVSLVLVDAVSDKETARFEAPEVLSPELVMDADATSVVVSDARGAVSVWMPDRRVIEPLALGGRPVRASVAASPDRSVLLTVEESGRMTAWRWPHHTTLWTTTVVADGAASVSPDGRLVAVPSQGRINLLDALTGKTLRQTTQLPGTGPRRVTWEDSARFVASDPDTVGGGSLVRCAAASGTCQELELADKAVLLAR